MIRVYVKLIGVPARGPASEAVEPVAQETRRPMALDLPEGATISTLVKRVQELGADTDSIRMTLLNGAAVEQDAKLSEKDAVTFVGPVTGE